MRTIPKTTILLIGILLLGGFLRFYAISDIPPGLYPDEAMNGNNALEAIATGNWKMFYPENNGREGLFINIQALSVWLFGNEPWALRVVSALFGTLTILGVYLLTKELFGEKSEARSTKSETNSNAQNSNTLNASPFRISDLFRISDFGFRIYEVAPLLAAFFTATSYWHINFSRIGFRAITIPFFAAFGMYWLMRGLRTGKISSIALAGIFIGLGFHTYIAFRFMPFIIAVPIILHLWNWHKNKKLQPTTYNLQPHHCVPCAVVLFLFVTFVVALPIGLYFLQHPADFLGRGGQVSIFAAERPLYEFVKSNLLTLQMFFWRGDCNPRHNFACQPELNPLVGIFFVIGVFTAFRELLKKQESGSKNQEKNGNSLILNSNFLILFLWLLFMSLPATLTAEGLPHALRSIGLIPPVMIIAGLGAAWLWSIIAMHLENARQNPIYTTRARQLSRVKKETALLALLLLLLIPLQTGRTYFYRFPSSPETYFAFATDFLHIGRYLNSLPPETEKYVLVNLSGTEVRGIPMPAQTIMFITDTFRDESRVAKHITYLTAASLASANIPAGAIIIPLNANRETIQLLKTRFPKIRFTAPGDFLTGVTVTK